MSKNKLPEGEENHSLERKEIDQETFSSSAAQHEAWSIASKGWRKWNKFLMEWLRPIGEKIVELAVVRGDEVVLDVATGTGEPGLSIARKLSNGRVIGVDFSEGMLETAEENARKSGVNNYETLLEDPSKSLSFGSNYFDVVTCRMGVMFFPDILLGLKEMVRVLKPNGRMVVAVWGPQDERATELGKILVKVLKMPQPPPDSPGPYRCSKSGRIKSLMEDAGLRDVKEIELKGRNTWDSGQQYIEFSSDVNPGIAMALQKLNHEERKEAIEDLTESLRSFESKDGKISFNWTAFVDYGLKN